MKIYFHGATVDVTRFSLKPPTRGVAHDQRIEVAPGIQARFETPVMSLAQPASS
jgi:hypothetical protein